MGIVIALVCASVAVCVALVFTTKSRTTDSPDPQSRPDFTELRAAVAEWAAVKTACLEYDLEHMRTSGVFVPRLPPALADQSADATRVLNRLASRVGPGVARDSITRMSSRADEIFTEEALNPAIVTEQWLVERIAEVRELGHLAEENLPA